MAFTVTDFADLARLLAAHPEWQAELRRLIRSDDFLALPVIVRELAEAQQRTETQVQALTTQVEGMATEVGDLQRAFGATIEEEAESFVQALLEEKGYRLLATHHSVVIDGEVDVVMELEAPTGETVWAVVEAKARLSYRQVREWGQRMQSRGWHERLAARVTRRHALHAGNLVSERDRRVTTRQEWPAPTWCMRMASGWTPAPWQRRKSRGSGW